ncbi:replication protein [Halodesulfovibrio marinisediminis]|uniref:Phage replication protein O n=1 Tax=Halodesulfovibrio marinisediminis DSM 17456 TaxID=1121457 RepID=A0A1N6IX33_9BACT|nr:replication protein [Halodesulfovibrio marinisediminis]SIO36579.1 phage replication protein O [Halodesulfovibrio marinisediminis DSM 17456]
MKLEDVMNIVKGKDKEVKKEKRFNFEVWSGKGELSGFTQIPNRLLLLLPALKLTKTELGLLLVIYRLTLGYGKKSKSVTQAALMEYLDVSKVSVSNALKSLNGLGIITYKKGCITVHDTHEWNLDLASPEDCFDS